MLILCSHTFWAKKRRERERKSVKDNEWKIKQWWKWRLIKLLMNRIQFHQHRYGWIRLLFFSFLIQTKSFSYDFIKYVFCVCVWCNSTLNSNLLQNLIPIFLSISLLHTHQPFPLSFCEIHEIRLFLTFFDVAIYFLLSCVLFSWILS